MTEWRACPDQPDYEISDIGTIRRVTKAFRGKPVGFVMKPRFSNSGYLQIELGPKHARIGYFVHRLVTRAFHGEPPSEAHWVAHNDGNRLNNAKGNLRWATPAENQADKRIHGTHLLGESVGTSKLSRVQVLEIRKRCRNGESQAKVGADYGLRQSYVSKIVTRGVWKHLPQDQSNG